MNIAVLVSGGGTNLQALLDATQDPTFPARIVLVGCNRAGARALDRAREAGVPVCVTDRDAYPRRVERQHELLGVVRESGAELVVLAGFDEVLVPDFVAAFSGRMLNTHPSLLPAFGGTLHAVEQALEHGVKVTGCTVHLVTDDLDNGPILFQRCVEVREDDSVESLHTRIRQQEHVVLCEAVRAFAEGRVQVEDRRARVIAS